jgi:putative ABC transport system substrate-binding protein
VLIFASGAERYAEIVADSGINAKVSPEAWTGEPAGGADTLGAFRQGLNDAGYVEHQNIGTRVPLGGGPIRSAARDGSRSGALPGGAHTDEPYPGALAAKAATATIPVVFLIVGDPVQICLVASLNRPGGNVTGATFYVAQLASRQLGVLHELLPKAETVGVLVNPNAPAANVKPQVKDLQLAAKALGLRLRVLDVGSERDADVALATLVGERADALFVTADGFFNTQIRDPLVALMARHRLPAMYGYRDFVAAL